MAISDWGAIAILLTLLLVGVYRGLRGQSLRENIHATLPAAIGCIIAAVAGRSGHPVLAVMVGVATLIHIHDVVRPATTRNSTPAGGHEP